MARIGESSPFLGMHTIEYEQKDGHCDLALNVDFTDGTIRCRPGFDTLQVYVDHSVIGMYCYEGDDGCKYILSITCKPAAVPQVVVGDDKGSVVFHVYDGAGNAFPIDVAYDMVATAGQPHGQAPVLAPFSFVEMGDVVYFTNGQGPLWKWAPRLGMKPIRVVPIVGQKSAAMMYILETPYAKFITYHNTVMVFGGLAASSNVTINGPIAARQSAFDLYLLQLYNHNQSILSYSSKHILYSDMGAPDAITGGSYVGIYEGASEITGIASLDQTLFLFTANSIHRVIGVPSGGDITHDVFSVSSIVGCLSQATIKQIPGYIVFLAADGVYRVDSEGTLEKVSDAMQRFFVGSWEPTVPRSVWASLAPHGFPWALDRGRIGTAAATVIPSAGLYLLSLPLCGGGPPGQITLAWNYKQNAWSLWAPGWTDAAANNGSMFLPAVYASFRTQPDTVYFGTHRSTANAYTSSCIARMRPIGSRGWPDKDKGRNSIPINMAYVSRRLGMGEETHKLLDAFLFRTRGTGTNTFTVYVAGEESQYDKDNSADATLTEEALVLTQHPGADADNLKTYFWGRFNWGPITAPPVGLTPGSGVQWTPAGRVTRSGRTGVVSRWYQYAVVQFPSDSLPADLEIYGVSSQFETVGERP